MNSSGAVSLLVLIAGINLVSGANILFYWGVSGYSHRISIWPLVEALSERGHKVTFFSPYESRDPPNPKYTIQDIVPKNLSRDLGYANMDFVENRLKNGPKGASDLWPEYYKGSLRGCKSILEDPEIIQWAKTSQFDLIVMDALLVECGYAFVHHFKAPHIHYSPSTHFPPMLETYRNPDENIPEFQYFYPTEMNLFQRIHNTLVNLHWRWRKYTEVFPYIEDLATKAFGWNETPDLDEIERNVSLVLVSGHYSIDVPRSLPPLFVDVAGMHTSPARKPLPERITRFIDSGKNGFVFLSFGTYLTLSACPKHLQNIFFTAMSKVNTNFIIKFVGPVPENIPKNVLPVGWVSQNDILAHPKIRAFISHGGLLGTQEAVYHAVPMVVIPLFAEQDYHSMRLVERGAGLSLELSELTELKLENAIREVISNEIYRENCKRTAVLFKDRLNKPLDTALWWVEYVLRHKGTVNLRPVRVNDSWFRRRNLDVWSIIALALLGGLAILSLLVWKIFKLDSILISRANESSTSVLSSKRVKVE